MLTRCTGEQQLQLRPSDLSVSFDFAMEPCGARLVIEIAKGEQAAQREAIIKQRGLVLTHTIGDDGTLAKFAELISLALTGISGHSYRRIGWQ